MGHPPNLFICPADPNPWIDRSRRSNSALPRWVTCAQVHSLSSTTSAAIPDAAASPRLPSNTVPTISSALPGREKARLDLSAMRNCPKSRSNWRTTAGLRELVDEWIRLSAELADLRLHEQRQAAQPTKIRPKSTIAKQKPKSSR
jgi:hypothetical protein